MADPGAAAEALPKPTRSRLGPGARALWALLYLLPKNTISRAAGRFAGVAWPAVIQRAELRLFARFAGVDLEEAAEPIEAYPTLQAFFTRALRPAARPIEGDENELISPCDGTWGAAGPIDGGTLVQVKGRTYRVRDLLGDVDRADRFEGGFFATFYLSPRDYHRFHVPTAGWIRRVDYWPGALWPVNRIGLEGVDGLFARNERICAYLEPEIEPDRHAGRLAALNDSFEVVAADSNGDLAAAIALVAVGATMVGSVRLSFNELATNRPRAGATRLELGAKGPRFARGDEWGHFEFGSTIVMLVPPETFQIQVKPPGTALRLGESIGRRFDSV